ncbi:MAG: DUF1330 domain-containing protein [Pseudomonadota bacterium]
MTDYIDPDRDQFEAFKRLPRDLPINMLNLVRLREIATYPSGETCSGLEAYRRYGEGSGPVFARVGGTIVWRGKPENVLIGPSDELWHVAFIARYPNAGAFLEMVTDATYREVVVHRQAGVQTSRLIRMGELPITDEFA